MKIQCSCGAKYSFEVTPESAANPVRFVCPACGVDSSAAVNELVRRELGVAAPAPAPAPKAPGLRLSREQAPAPAPPAAAPPAPVAAVPAALVCAKHGEPAAEQCATCRKPICPKCMALFGYFCSPFCKTKAEAASINVPVYAGLASSVEAKFWRKTGLIIGTGIAVVVLAVGFGVWYRLFGSVPSTHFSLHFDQRAEVGQCQNVGLDQLVSLHGGTLARYDLKTKQAVWSHELFTQQDVDNLVAEFNRAETGDSYRAPIETKQRMARLELESSLSLMVSGQNIWVSTQTNLTHFDWATGNPSQTVSLGAYPGELIAGEDEMLMVREVPTGVKYVTHISFATGDSHTEEFHEKAKMIVADSGNGSGGGLPSAEGDPNKPLDPGKVADQAQNLTTPGRLALPALLANNLHQQQILAAARDSDQKNTSSNAVQPEVASEGFTLVPSKYGYLQYTVKLLEERITTRVAMKAPPARRVLDGNLTAGQGTEAENELLNDMQRASGGDKISEDESRYQVTLRRPDSADVADWTGEVIGPPVVYALKTVNAIAAGKSVTVFDKSNKKLWDASLTYQVAPSHDRPTGEPALTGACPCAENGGTLYVVDQAVLTAFDLATGNARWRLPSVGIMGLFFDEHGAVYVNTTTANPDKIRYARQIDVSEAIDTVLMKVDPEAGKSLWTIKTGGFAYYVSGPYVYTVLSHDQPVDDMASDLTSGLQKPSFLRIMRINPKDGGVLWEHDQDRAPLDIRFDQNFIYLEFHKEVQVLKYLEL